MKFKVVVIPAYVVILANAGIHVFSLHPPTYFNFHTTLRQIVILANAGIHVFKNRKR